MTFFNGTKLFNTKGYYKIWVEVCDEGMGIFGKDGSDSKDLIISFPEFSEAQQVMSMIAEHYTDDDEIYWLER